MTTLLAEDYGHHPVDEVLHVAAIHRLDSLLEEAHALSDIHTRLQTGEPVTIEIAQEAMAQPMVKTLMKRDPQYRIAMEAANGNAFQLGILIMAAIIAVIGLIMKLMGKGSSSSGGGGGGSSGTWSGSESSNARANAESIRDSVKDTSMAVRHAKMLKANIEPGSLEAHIVSNKEYLERMMEILNGFAAANVRQMKQEILQLEDLFHKISNDSRAGAKESEIEAALDNAEKLMKRTADSHSSKLLEPRTARMRLERLLQTQAPLTSVTFELAITLWGAAAGCNSVVIEMYGENLEKEFGDLEEIGKKSSEMQKEMERGLKEHGNSMSATKYRQASLTLDMIRKKGEFFSEKAKEIRMMHRHQRATQSAAGKFVTVLKSILEEGRSSHSQEQITELEKLIRKLQAFHKDPTKKFE